MGVDVGSATGYLDLDINGFLSGLRSAQSEANAAASKLETVGSKFVAVGDSISSVGASMTNFITVPIATAAAAVVKSYADMEQAIGGVETLFKDSASDVIANAETAYYRAGTSATNYMEQVTSFSARLLQSTGGDTKEAARIADMAMVDMSDNANKFGTNIESIQNAYQGFAKANYTMLDNLKLGYGGTKEEMLRLLADAEKLTGIKYDIDNLSDVYEAIHVIQEELGVTGTTALEATETISGSFGMAKAAISDFLANLGKPGADMEKFKQNMIYALKVVIENIKTVLGTIWENIPLEGWQKNLIAAAAAAGPLLTVVGKLTTGVGKMLITFGKMPAMMKKVKAGLGVVKAAIAGISAPVVAVIAIIALLVAAFVNLWKNNEEFRDKITAIWERIKGIFDEFVQGVVDRLNALGFDFKDITELMGALWEGFCNLLAPLFEGVFTQVANLLEAALDIITGILDIFIGLFTGNWEQMWEGIKGIFSSVWDFIVNIFTNIGNTLKGILDAICGWFGTTWDDTWTSIKDFFVNTWDAIVSFFTNIVASIEAAVSNFITNIINFFEQLPTNISNFITNAYNSVVTWVDDMVAKAKEMGTNFIDAVVSFFTQLPGEVLQFITSALTNVQIWVTDMAAKASEMGTGFINNVVSFMTQLPEKIQTYLDSAIANLVTWVTQMGQKGTDAVAALINSVTTAAVDIAEEVMSVGKNIVEGIWNGIVAAKDAFVTNVSNFFSGIIDGIMDLFGISSPSRGFATEVGQRLPSGVVVGFERAMPAAMHKIQTALNNGIDNLDADDIDVGAEATVTGFAAKMKLVYDDVATWFETVEMRITNSIDRMTQNLMNLMYAGQTMVNPDGTFGYVGYNGFGGHRRPTTPTFVGGPPNDGSGDTFNFYSPRPISEIEAARLLKQTKRDMSEGF